jgi:hypothetical protein
MEELSEGALKADKTPERQNRHNLRLPVRFQAVGSKSDSQVGHTTNVSASGMFISAHSPLPASTMIEILVVREGEVLVVLGEVIRALTTAPLTRSDEPCGMGIRFLAPDDPSVGTLVGDWLQYVTRQFQSPAERRSGSTPGYAQT